MYPKDKLQLFKNENPAVRCETFCCFQPATYFIGRPDGPRNMYTNLCQSCKDSLVDGLIHNEKEALLQRIKDLEKIERQEKEKKEGKEYNCQYCGQGPFYSGLALANHVRLECKEVSKTGTNA